MLLTAEPSFPPHQSFFEDKLSTLSLMFERNLWWAPCIFKRVFFFFLRLCVSGNEGSSPLFSLRSSCSALLVPHPDPDVIMQRGCVRGGSTKVSSRRPGSLLAGGWLGLPRPRPSPRPAAPLALAPPAVSLRTGEGARGCGPSAEVCALRGFRSSPLFGPVRPDIGSRADPSRRRSG